MTVRSRQWTALVLSALLALSAAGCGKKEEEPAQDNGLQLGYTESTVATDSNALQGTVDAMFEAAAERGVGVEYKGDAFSSDGTNFDCFLGNPSDAEKDVFLAIYGDSALTDELYLSQLIPPGRAIDHVALNHPLLAGDNTCYVVFTQVVTEDGVQKMDGQSSVTVTFHVSQ